MSIEIGLGTEGFGMVVRNLKKKIGPFRSIYTCRLEPWRLGKVGCLILSEASFMYFMCNESLN